MNESYFSSKSSCTTNTMDACIRIICQLEINNEIRSPKVNSSSMIVEIGYLVVHQYPKCKFYGFHRFVGISIRTQIGNKKNSDDQIQLISSDSMKDICLISIFREQYMLVLLNTKSKPQSVSSFI